MHVGAGTRKAVHVGSQKTLELVLDVYVVGQFVAGSLLRDGLGQFVAGWTDICGQFVAGWTRWSGYPQGVSMEAVDAVEAVEAVEHSWTSTVMHESLGLYQKNKWLFLKHSAFLGEVTSQSRTVIHPIFTGKRTHIFEDVRVYLFVVEGREKMCILPGGEKEDRRSVEEGRVWSVRLIRVSLEGCSCFVGCVQ